MKEFIKKYKHLIFIFIFTFLIYEVFAFYIAYEDTIPSYGFSYAIAKGQIPYKDFNIISTPLYAFIMSIGLKFFNNYLMFIIEQSILVTTQFYFLFKMYGKKSYLVYLSMVVILSLGFLPTYNYMCFFCMVILLYLEKEHQDKDYLIGLFIGLSILSKHTVGVFFILPTLIFYYKDIKKVLKRTLGALVPGVIFVIYLLITNSFNNFIDLCVLGLFDFSSSNGHTITFWSIIAIVIFIIEIIIIIRNKNNILNYYLLFSIFFAVPLFDRQHIHWVISAFIIMLLPYINIKDKNIYRFVIPITVEFSVIYFIIYSLYEPVTITSKLNHYNYSVRFKDEYEFYLRFNKIVNKARKKYDKVIVQMGYYQVILDVSNDRKLDYYDILLTGNYGKKGSNGMIKEMDNMHNVSFAYLKSAYKKDKDGQWDRNMIDYVRNNWKNITTEEKDFYKYGYDIYYKE